MTAVFRYRPLGYFAAVFTATSILWLSAAWFSHVEGASTVAMAMLLLGLMAPWIISSLLIRRSGDQDLRREHRQRVSDLRRIRPLLLLGAVLLMPASVVLSVALSVPFGGAWEQLQLAEGFSFSIGAVPALVVLLLAATFEELGWRGYAFDALQQRFRMPIAMVLFGILWSLWHLPLILVDGSYQQGLVHDSPLYALNFFVSIVPMGIIISRVCLQHRKSVLAAIVFHFVINMSQEALDITQSTKCVQTLVLAAVAVGLLWRPGRREHATPGAGTDRRSGAAATTAVEATVAASAWRSWYVHGVLIVVLFGQVAALSGWARAWAVGGAPSELVVGGLAMQGGWICLLGWALIRPAGRVLVLVSTAVAMLLGNLLHTMVGQVAGSIAAGAMVANGLAGLVGVGVVVSAAWVAGQSAGSCRSLNAGAGLR